MSDHNVENELLPLLDADEQLIWTGQPKQGIVFYSMDIFLVPFSVIWGGFVLWGVVSSIFSEKEMPLNVVFYLMPFILAALYITVGRFIIDAQRRRKIWYGITKDRIVIKSLYFRKILISVNIKAISDITLDQQWGNRGDHHIRTGGVESSNTEPCVSVDGHKA